MFTSRDDGRQAVPCAVDDREPPPDDEQFDWARFERLIARDPHRVHPALVPAPTACPSGPVAAHLDSGTVVPGRLADSELVDAVVGFEHLISWAGARQARLLAEFARRRPADDAAAGLSEQPRPTSRWAPDEISLALSQSRVTAAAKLGQATWLSDVLGDTLTGWESGRLDALKVRAICDATLRLDPAKARHVQGRVLSRATTQTLTQVKAALKRAVLAVDPDGGDKRHQKAHDERRVVLTPVEDGMATLWACMTAPDAQTCYGWLTALARGLGRDDPRGMDARRTDLMRDLLTGRLTITPSDPTPSDPAPGDPAPGDTGAADTADPATGDGSGDSGVGAGGHESGCRGCDSPTGQPPPPPSRPWRPAPVAPGKPLVQIVIPLTTLTGTQDQPSELIGYGPIPPTLARALADDSVWKRLVTDPVSGTLLDHGRTTYRPPAALAEFVRARDQTCRFPPCNRRALDTELDHTVSWTAADGPTADHNLYGGCPHHHHLKHDAPGWTVTQTPDGLITWTTPTGHRYTSEPYDYRPEPTPRAAAPSTATPPTPARPVLPDPWTLDPGPDDAPF